MLINYTVKKMTIKPSTKEHIEKKLSKLDKFFSDNANASVMLRLERDRVTAELTIRDNSMIYRAEDEQVDLLDAFDNAFDNIVRRIRKQKTKLASRLRDTDFAALNPIDEVDETAEFDVIKTKKFAMKPLSVQEAILQMNLLGHQFFVFIDDQTEDTCVVYKRKDGNYGLIVPEK